MELIDGVVCTNYETVRFWSGPSSLHRQAVETFGPKDDPSAVNRDLYSSLSNAVDNRAFPAVRKHPAGKTCRVLVWRLAVDKLETADT